ncbi:MAG: hypothetical protein RB191_05400 [Terriglobia bacterium]|nr:hypothetical protein [Terriglobia bacterium]
MKYLPMAILFILVVTILCMSRYAETSKENHQENASHINGITITPNQASESAKEADKAEDSPCWIDTFAWPEGATAWALLLTLFVIAWQSTETRDAAKAANAQIKMMKDKERARLRFELDSFSPESNKATIGYKVKGTVSIFGSTEAFIEKTVFFAGIQREGEGEVAIIPAPMAEFPNVIRPGSDPLKTWTILWRTKFTSSWVPTANEGIDDVLKEESIMFCRGAIHYADVFDGKWVFLFSRRYRVYLLPDRKVAGGYWEDFGKPEDNGEYKAN